MGLKGAVLHEPDARLVPTMFTFGLKGSHNVSSGNDIEGFRGSSFMKQERSVVMMQNALTIEAPAWLGVTRVRGHREAPLGRAVGFAVD